MRREAHAPADSYPLLRGAPEPFPQSNTLALYISNRRTISPIPIRLLIYSSISRFHQTANCLSASLSLQKNLLFSLYILLFVNFVIMAYEQSFGAPNMHLGSEGDVSRKQKRNSVSQSAMVPENSNGGFDCNICLESCHEPVVTLCGHLYCWPCIYKWLHIQSSSFESDERPRCPVCKAFISNSSLVPLYGRGRSPFDSEAKKRQLDSTVPPRPPALGLNTLLATSASVSHDSNQQSSPNPFHPDNQTFNQQQYFPNPSSNYSSVPPTLGSPTTTSFFSPTINMVSEIVFAGMFGSSDTNMFAYPYSNSYPLIGNGSPRLRRHEIQLDKSLNRLSIFLFCCIALCLILF